jgi:hypothetical protein
MTRRPNVEEQPQPAIASVLGIQYAEPIDDAAGWAQVFHDTRQAPAPPTSPMFIGPLGELTRLIAPHVPWDPIGFHMQALVIIGNYLGYRPYVAEGATRRRSNLFLALIGGTGSGKGSSLAWVNWMMSAIDSTYMDDRVVAALDSGQGLLRKITDPVYAIDKNGKEVLSMEGSTDKRVIYIEEELGQLFTKMLSQDKIEKMVTKGWDSGVMETVTKHESMRCATPHASIIGHITPDELYDRLETRLVENGFSNRWLYVLIKPTQILDLEPQPHELDGALQLATEIGKQVRQVADDPSAEEFTLSSDAMDLFRETSRFMYDHRPTGAMQKQVVRWRPQMFKLSLVYAAMDGKTTIEAEHFAAARSAWAYNARSARAFFGGMTGDSNADKFMAMWKAIGFDSITLSDVSDLFSKNLAAVKRDKMLNQLQRDGVLTISQGESGPNGGRRPYLVNYTGDIQASELMPNHW